jgi:anaerobic selenocysteine-containing dehydrogenase
MPHEIVRSVCRMCHGGCGALIHVNDGRVERVVGDRANPNNTGFLCTKGRASGELVHHPDRLTQPLRRVGPRGSRRFEPIGWDEACATVASRLAAARDSFGPESIVLCQGTDRNFQEWTFRFANALGTPNVLGPAHVCFYPRVMAGIFTLGAFTFCDYEATPDRLVVWGSNKVVTHGDGVIGVRLLKALQRGTELAVIDPRRTQLAARARYWLQVRPGTDLALALGLLNVVVREGLYDRDFVARYTVGFEALRAHLRPFDPDWTAAATGVPARSVEEVARFYASPGSAAIEVGTGVEQNRNSFQCLRALNILSAVCGNIDRPGGDVIWEPSGIIGRRALPASERLPESQSRRRLGSRDHAILSLAGWAHPAAVWKAILESDPYSVRALLVLGSNPILTYADSDRVHRALSAVDFLVVSDLFLTPTAELADIVLPVSSWLERDQIVEHAHYVAPRVRAVEVGACRSDEEILNELAHRLGIGDAFWSEAGASLDDRLEPIGLSWSSLIERAYIGNNLRYFKYRSEGFRTRSGKLHLSSEGLARLGYDPLPIYRPPKRRPGHYVLTSRHSPNYFNSEFRQLRSLRRLEPFPTADVHPESAAKEGLCEGDWVAVIVDGREAYFRAHLTDEVAPGVVYVAASWWYPELPGSAGWRTSNVNLLTSDEEANAEMGSQNLRGISCRLRVCREQDLPVLPRAVGAKRV